MSWIHIDDIAGIFQFAVENDSVIGPINGTAPNPVRNAEFSKTFSDVLRTRLDPLAKVRPARTARSSTQARARRSGWHHHDRPEGPAGQGT